MIVNNLNNLRKLAKFQFYKLSIAKSTLQKLDTQFSNIQNNKLNNMNEKIIINKELGRQIQQSNHSINRKDMVYKFAENKFTYNGLIYKNIYNFTSSSNPTQVSLLQQVQAKVLQIVKRFKPSLFEYQILPQTYTQTKSQSQSQPFPKINTSNKKKKLDKNIKFKDQGFDSLDITQMVVSMEQIFGIQLTDQQARSIQSISMAIDIFFTKINARVMNKIIQQQQIQTNIVGNK